MYSKMGHIVVMGDFNAHFKGQVYIKPTDARGIHFQDKVRYHNLVAVNTLPFFTGANASFVSYGDIYESLIDHILIPDVKLDTVISCEITDDHVLNVSRHRPVVCVISIGDTCFENLNCNTESHIKWKKVDEHILQLYKTKLRSALLNNECDDIADIHNRIDNRYKNIVTSIVNISDSVLPKTKFRHFLKPYWDQQFKDLHAVMRQRRREWILDGRPRNNDHSSYRRYKGAKCLFRFQHRKCAQNYLNELNRVIDDAAELDSAFFWKKLTIGENQNPQAQVQK